MGEIVKAEGDLFPTIPGLKTSGGVSMTPPPDAILGEVTGMVQNAMKSIPEGERGALVGVTTMDGHGKLNVNLVLAVKVNGHVNVLQWIGKSWGQPVSGGAAVQVHW